MYSVLFNFPVPLEECCSKQEELERFLVICLNYIRYYYYNLTPVVYYSPLLYLQENVAPNKRSQNQFQSCPIPEWNTEHVCHWLMALELDKYTPLFKDRSITGTQLLAMDGSKFKVHIRGLLIGKPYLRVHIL